MKGRIVSICLVVAAIAVLLTALLLKLIDVVLGLRVTPEEEELGLDLFQHGESAHCYD